MSMGIPADLGLASPYSRQYALMLEHTRKPVVFVCENNLYMEYTPVGDVTAVKHPAADRAAAYGLPSIVVDGNRWYLLYERLDDGIWLAVSTDHRTFVNVDDEPLVLDVRALG